MSGKKCCVCDGPIVNGRCRFCGMPYRRDLELYHVNEQRRDHEKHASLEAKKILREKEIPLGDKQGKKAASRSVKKAAGKQPASLAAAYSQGKKTSYKTTRAKPETKKKKLGLSWLFFLLIVVVALASVGIPLLEERGIDSVSKLTEEVRDYGVEGLLERLSGEEDAKEKLVEELEEESPIPRTVSAKGESWKGILEPGRYVVGCQLPEGTYRIWTDCPQDVFLDVEAEGYYDYFTFSRNPQGTYDVTEAEEDLLEGMTLYIQAGAVSLETKNGQLDELQTALKNPLTENYMLEEPKDKAKIRVGRDLEPGWYDIRIEGEGYLSLELTRKDKTTEYITLYHYGEESADIFRYENLEDGDVMAVSGCYDVERLILEPSEYIYEK